jgi:hypothetical protein
MMNMVDSKLNLAKSLNNILFFGEPVVKVFFSSGTNGQSLSS